MPQTNSLRCSSRLNDIWVDGCFIHILKITKHTPSTNHLFIIFRKVLYLTVWNSIHWFIAGLLNATLSLQIAQQNSMWTNNVLAHSEKQSTGSFQKDIYDPWTGVHWSVTLWSTSSETKQHVAYVTDIIWNVTGLWFHITPAPEDVFLSAFVNQMTSLLVSVTTESSRLKVMNIGVRQEDSDRKAKSSWWLLG